MRSLVNTFHNPIVLSPDPDTKYTPFGENTKLVIKLVWPEKVLIHYSVYTLHIPIVLSINPDVKYNPFGENAILIGVIF